MQRVFDPRTKAVTYDVPNVEGLGFDWPALKATTEDFDRLRRDYDRTVQKIRELFNAQRDAEAKDNQALAAALREGRQDPGTKHSDKLAADLKNAERRRDGLQLALQEQAAVITARINEHRSAWRSEVSDRLPAAQNRLEAAVREVEAARGELQGLNGLVDWLQEPSKPYAPQEAAKNTTVVIQGGINRQDQEATLSSIRREAESA